MKNINITFLKTQQEFIECCYLCDGCFDGYTAEFFYNYLLETGIDGKNSVIAKVGDEIIGLCIVTNEKIYDSYPEFKWKKPIKNLRLKRRQNKCISVLAIKPEYRNLNISTILINTTINNLRKEGCEWCYVQVLHHLKTHTLWKKYGCKEIFDYDGTKHYVLPLTPKVKKIIGECINLNLNKSDFEFMMEKINNMEKIKLTESSLKKMISEAVKTAINEIGFKPIPNAPKKPEQLKLDMPFDKDDKVEQVLNDNYFYVKTFDVKEGRASIIKIYTCNGYQRDDDSMAMHNKRSAENIERIRTEMKEMLCQACGIDEININISYPKPFTMIVKVRCPKENI